MQSKLIVKINKFSSFLGDSMVKKILLAPEVRPTLSPNTLATKFYSQTSLYGHLYNKDTSLLRTAHLVQETKISYKLYLCNIDTFTIGTLFSVSLVSILKRYDCVIISRRSSYLPIFLLSYLLLE